MFYFTPLRGFFSPFPHGTSSLSVTTEYLALEDGPPSFRQGFSCPALLTNNPTRPIDFIYRTITLLWCGFPAGFDYRSDFLLALLRFALKTDCRTTPLRNARSLHVDGLGCSRFARHYYGNLG